MITNFISCSKKTFVVLKPRRFFLLFMNKLFFSIALLFIAINIQAQQIRPLASAEILSSIKKLQTTSTVMYLAAHPDDENTRLISYLVHERNVRTIYLSLTRGDGGQNIIGNEQGVALGLIRTLEMNEARKMDGAEQLYTSAIDFGFSKNPEEVFQFWNKQRLIDEVKRAIQLTRPDLIITRFPTTGEGGHGQHTASAIIALEAFQQLEQEAKNNKNTWVPIRLLFNAFNFGGRSTQKEDQLKIPINQYNPLLGKSYGELAGQSRSMHKSQGAGTPQSFGIYQEYFQHLAGKEAKNDLLDDITTDWKSINPAIYKNINEIITNYQISAPEKSLPALLALKQQIAAIKDNHLKIQKLELLDKIIRSCAGITAEFLTDNPTYAPKDTITGLLSVIARAPGVQLLKVEAPVDSHYRTLKTYNHKLGIDTSFIDNLSITAPNQYDNPYWLTKADDPNHFTAMKNQPIGLAVNTPKAIKVSVLVENMQLVLEIPVSYKRLDPLRGDVINEIRIEPALSIAPVSQLLFLEKNQATSTQLQLKTNKALQDIQIYGTNSTDHNVAKHTLLSLKTLRAGIDTIISVNLPKALLSSNKIFYSAQTAQGNTIFNQSQNILKYDHIPETQYLEIASQKLITKEWTNYAKNIGYIQGADDWVDDILKELGINVVNLKWKDFQNPTMIASLDAIVVGIRAYNVNTEIASLHPLLMAYVQNGGTLIVQYNTDKNLRTSQLGPYPFEISRNRITQEQAPTKVLLPKHPLLNYPNVIQSADWDHWVQERGVYYPSNWDKQYDALISQQEFKENALQSGLLYTKYGKGHYIYTPLAFFRQLPAGNTGAIKIFMNLLSVGKKSK